MKETKTCKICVLPETRDLPLDDGGLCKYCNSSSVLKHLSTRPNEAALEERIRQIKARGKDGKYDCLVAWSGGRDSTYMLHQLVVKHKLRCAAVFGRTPFTPTEIERSVHSISTRLKVDLIEEDTPPDHNEIAGFCLRQYLRTHAPIFINLACSSCKFVNRAIFGHAKKLGIGTVIYGGNRFEYFPSGPASIDIGSENRYSFINMTKDHLSRIWRGLVFLAQSPTLIRHLSTFAQASLLYLNQYTIYLRLRYPGIFRFDYYHHADWNEEKINQVLAQLDWELPHGCNTTWRADCVFESVKNVAFQNELGFTHTQAMYSNLIRVGKMTRESALRRLKSEGVSEPRLRQALRICGLPEETFSIPGNPAKANAPAIPRDSRHSHSQQSFASEFRKPARQEATPSMP